MGDDGDGTLDVRWLRPDGAPMTDEDWQNGLTRSMAVLLAGEGERLALLFNAYHEPLGFTLPPALEGGWTQLIDTAAGIAAPRRGASIPGPTYVVEGRALVLLETAA